jgi:hypothetical protein
VNDSLDNSRMCMPSPLVSIGIISPPRLRCSCVDIRERLLDSVLVESGTKGFDGRPPAIPSEPRREAMNGFPRGVSSPRLGLERAIPPEKGPCG